MSKAGPLMPMLFVLIQIIAFLILISIKFDEWRNSIIIKNLLPHLENYYNWSLAGACVMIAGLVVNVTHYLAARLKFFIQIGTILIIAGMCVVSVGEFYELNHDNEYNEKTALWIIVLSGGLLVIYESIAALA